MSEIRATTISDLAGTGPATLTGQYAAKAWANINGSAPNFNGSFNMSSITDVGPAGDYIVNFASSFANDDYAVGYMGEAGRIIVITASSFNFARILDNGSAIDGPCHITCTGDLA
jgi:hypothetical protein